MTTYAQSGVNNDLKEQASKMLYEAAKRTWENRKGKFGEIISAHDDFSALRGINVGNLPEGTMLSLGFDGVGTKMELGERLNKHDTVAFDLFAMVCDDAVVRGAEPVLVGSILDVKSLKTPEGNYFLDQLSQLANGYEAAAKAARVAVINGEIAELGARVSGYGAFNYNWGASVALFAQKHRAITGKDIAPGQALVGLREYGFRSNGLSLVRKIFREHFGEEYQSYGHVTMQALRPSTIYCAAVCDMFGGAFDEPQAPLTGVAHITGGGLPEKISRVLRPSKLGATIDDACVPPEIMLLCQKQGTVSDEEAYKTWNMGQGMVLITSDASAVMDVAKRHGIESKVIGTVTQEPGIRIVSKGAFATGKVLHF